MLQKAGFYLYTRIQESNCEKLLVGLFLWMQGFTSCGISPISSTHHTPHILRHGQGGNSTYITTSCEIKVVMLGDSI